MTIDQLISDIWATFPKIVFMEREGAMCGKRQWMICGEHSVVMPDGLPVFTDWQHYSEAGTHDGGVHCAFISWLEFRGWYLERNDEFWFVPTALPTPEEVAEYLAAYEAIAAKRSTESAGCIDDGCPF